MSVYFTLATVDVFVYRIYQRDINVFNWEVYSKDRAFLLTSVSAATYTKEYSTKKIIWKVSNVLFEH